MLDFRLQSCVTVRMGSCPTFLSPVAALGDVMGKAKGDDANHLLRVANRGP